MIKLTSPNRVVWENGAPTRKIEFTEVLVNPSNVLSVERYKGRNLNEGWDCLKITMTNNIVFYDTRSLEEFHEEQTAQNKRASDQLALR